MRLRRNEYEILNQMLDDAIAGTFEESRFDESELSKLRTKLMRYLSTAAMSERKQVIAKLAMLVRNLEPKQKQNCAQHDFNDENEYRAVLGALK